MMYLQAPAWRGPFLPFGKGGLYIDPPYRGEKLGSFRGIGRHRARGLGQDDSDQITDYTISGSFPTGTAQPAVTGAPLPSYQSQVGAALAPVPTVALNPPSSSGTSASAPNYWAWLGVGGIVVVVVAVASGGKRRRR